MNSASANYSLIYVQSNRGMCAISRSDYAITQFALYSLSSTIDCLILC